MASAQGDDTGKAGREPVGGVVDKGQRASVWALPGQHCPFELDSPTCPESECAKFAVIGGAFAFQPAVVGRWNVHVLPAMQSGQNNPAAGMA